MPDIETFSSLLARVETATGPDRELDADIATIIGGYVYEKRGRDQKAWFYPASSPGNYRRDRFSLPRYTASIDDAVGLIERVMPSGWTRIDVWNTDDVKLVTASVLPLPVPNSTSSGRAATPPLALLAALLRALIAKEEGNG